jgi:chromosomal replication initiation ATPase DnaA
MIKFESLVNIVCICCGISKDNFFSSSRARPFVLARHLFFYIARYKLGHKLMTIAQYIGRDHATVMHGIDTVNNLLAVNDSQVQPIYLKIVEALTKEYEQPAQLVINCPNAYTAQEIAVMLARDYNCRVQPS